MISKKAIESIYKQYSKLPESPDFLDIILLFEGVHPSHGIEIDGNDLIINSVEEWSPFHTLPLDRIYAIVDFEENIGIVLHSSIVFLSKRSPEVNIHIKAHEPSFMDKFKAMFCQES